MRVIPGWLVVGLVLGTFTVGTLVGGLAVADGAPWWALPFICLGGSLAGAATTGLLERGRQRRARSVATTRPAG